jgi:hypothetical protein
MNTDQVPKEIRVVSERYYPVRLALGKSVTGRIFFVKKMSCNLQTLQGSSVHRLLRKQNGGHKGDSSLDLIKSTIDDPNLLSFASHVSRGWSGSSRPLSVFEFCGQSLQECLTENTEEVLSLFLSLRSAVLSIENDVSSTTQGVWDVRLIQTYYERRHNFVSDICQKILNLQLVGSLVDIIERCLVKVCQPADLVAYHEDTQLLLEESCNCENSKMGKVLAYFDGTFPLKENQDESIDMETS